MKKVEETGVFLYLPKELYLKFKSILVLEGTTIKTKVYEFIAQYVYEYENRK